MSVNCNMSSSVVTANTPRSELGSVSSVLRYQNVLYEIIREGDLLNELETNLLGQTSPQQDQSIVSEQDNVVIVNTCNVQTVSRSQSQETEECTHLLTCPVCQEKVDEEKELYKKKKKKFIKMYEKLKNGYNLEIAKMQHERKRWGHLDSKELELRKKRDELQRWQNRMELEYKKREIDLESGVNKRKEILCELARHTKEQHQQLAQTMKDLLAESERLKEKENVFARQVKEAEQALVDKSETVHKQLANVIAIIEENVESLKEERGSLNAEKEHLSQIKNVTINKNSNYEDLRQHYTFIKSKLDTLKKQLVCLKQSKLKKIMDKSSMTENVADVENILDQLYEAKVKLKNDQSKMCGCECRYGNDGVNNDVDEMDQAGVVRKETDVIVQMVTGDKPTEEASCNSRSLQMKLDKFKQDNEALKDLIIQQQELIKSLEQEQAQLHAKVMSTHLQTINDRRIHLRSQKECGQIRSKRKELVHKVKTSEVTKSDIGGDSHREDLKDNIRRLRKLEIESEAVDKSYDQLLKLKKDRTRVFTYSDGCLMSLEALRKDPYVRTINRTVSYSDEKLNDGRASPKIYGDGFSLDTKPKSLKEFDNYIDKSLDELRRLYLSRNSSHQSYKIPLNDNPCTSAKSSPVSMENLALEEVHRGLDKVSLLSISNEDLKMCEQYKNEINEIFLKCEELTKKKRKPAETPSDDYVSLKRSSSADVDELAEQFINETDLNISAKNTSSEALVTRIEKDVTPKGPNGDSPKQEDVNPNEDLLDVDYFDTFSDVSLEYDSTSETASIYKNNSNDSFF